MFTKVSNFSEIDLERYGAFRLCYIDRIEEEIYNYPNSSDLRFSYYQTWIPNPEYIEGEVDHYAFFTPVFDKQWGDDWRMPTEEELYELLSFCSWQWITINGVNGYKVVGPNGNSIFLPAAGTSNSEHNECGCYWTGSFSDEDCHWDALCLKFNDDEFGHYSTYSHPYEGLTIRPVTDKSN